MNIFCPESYNFRLDTTWFEPTPSSASHEKKMFFGTGKASQIFLDFHLQNGF